ncbi:MAG: hypothetical protein IPK15_23790 [Verrucomicrobia bacterium]|nr:hypothetical protein [Verrucomicrobiota bacterium]
MKLLGYHSIFRLLGGDLAPSSLRIFTSSQQSEWAHPRLAGSHHGQSGNPLLHVKHLMLPPLSTLRAQSFCAPALAKYCWLLAAFLGTSFGALSSASAEELLLGNLPGEQDFPAVLLHDTGGVVAFEDNRIGTGKDGRGISAVLLGQNLEAQGQPFRVNQLSLGKHEKPQVVKLGSGKTLISWEVRAGAKAGIYTRLLETNGQVGAAETLFSTPTSKKTIKQTAKWAAHYRGKWKTRTHKFKDLIANTREQVGAVSVASLPDGGAVFVYQAMRRCETNSWTLVDQTYLSRGKFLTNAVLRPTKVTEDWMFDVFMQRVNANGAKVGPEVLVNQYANFNQRTPAVAVLENGNVVVVWVCEFPATSDWRANFRVDLMARIFTPDGGPVGDEFVLSASDVIAQANPSLVRSGGGFLAAWSQQVGTATSGWDVYARSFGADGTASGAAFRVNAFTSGDQFAPRIASWGERQLVVWTSAGQDGSGDGIYARKLASGAFDGGEFGINEQTISRQYHPAVVADGAGRSMVLWSGFSGRTGFDLFSKILILGSQ